VNHILEGMNQPYYETATNVFLPLDNLETPFWTDINAPTDPYINLYASPTDSNSKLYWSEST
jgi:hypothetical protein